LNQLTFSRHFYEATSIHRSRPFDLQLRIIFLSLIFLPLAHPFHLQTCYRRASSMGGNDDWTVGSDTFPFLIEELNHPTTATFPKTRSGYQLVLIVHRNFLLVATIIRRLFYRTRLIKVEHKSFAVWLVSNTPSFCIQHGLSESSTILYLQFGLYGAQLLFCI